MNRMLFALLFLALASWGQQERIAIVNTVDDGDPSIEPTDLRYLTVKLREIAQNVLQGKYGIMSEQSIIDKLGKDNAEKACKESEGCLARLGRKINADYICQARLGRFGGNLTISVELYNSASGLQIGTIGWDAKNTKGLLAVMNEKAPDLFRKMPGVSSNSKTAFPGIGDLEKTGGFEFDGKRRYLVNLSSDPAGAGLSFNGLPIAKCTKTPCNVELPEDSIRIIANLEQYETADTTVFIKQNKQNIKIELKPNFGILEIKPAYSNGIGKNKNWSLTINGKSYSSLKPSLSPGEYNVNLSHECYEDINFKRTIEKGKREVVDMSSDGGIELKKGGLDLSAELDDKPVSEPVYVNGKQVGETPFSDAVPVCANIGIGSSKDRVDVKIVYNQTVKHKHQMGHFDPSAWTLSFYGGGVTYSLPNGEERYVNSINAMIGLELIGDVSLFGMGFFVGLGNGPANTFELPLGFEFKKIFWISERRLAMPISLGVVFRILGGDMENREVAKFIESPDFFNEPESYFNETRGIDALSIGVISAIDLQYFITKSFSIYAGYMYRIYDNPEWGFTYNGDPFKVPEQYAPFTNPRERVLGVPGMLRIGLKYNGRNSVSTSSGDNSDNSGALKTWWMPDVFTDSRDGKRYRYVTIGKQIWMAENLNYKTENSWCIDKNEENCQKYGRLYEWETATKVCPNGWHLPSNIEWNVLQSAVGIGNAGKHLKAKYGWGVNGNGLDSYGFSALPISSTNFVGFWWSSDYYLWGMDNEDKVFFAPASSGERSVFSVRCMKD